MCQSLVENAVRKPFERLRYSEALSRLNKDGRVLSGDSDFNREEELRLTQLLGGPVFISHWPHSIKPFYMAHSQEYPDTVSTRSVRGVSKCYVGVLLNCFTI